jgi:Domain of unknown function (DUF5916)
LAGLFALLLWPVHASAQTSSRPILRVSPLTGELRLDGRLDEPDWAAADSILDLTQVEPTQGGPPSARTVVKVLANARELVIGVVAWDAAGAGFVSFSKAPDSELRNEDHITLVLDTFLDGRRGYIFAINPSGARYDALVGGQGAEPNPNWDAIWEGATARSAEAWSAEIRIPVKSLAFRDGLSTWGFNIERRIQRFQETDRWAGAQQNYAIDQVVRAGVLTQLPEFGLGIGLSIRPSFTAGAAVASPGAAIVGTKHVSIDVTQRLGSNALASFTANTDFAETEVDTRRTNLTRFPLLFPEKRTFFLEGSDIFDFGLGLGEELIPFFSRRIGLVSGQSVPIEAGAKVNGRIGATRVGALMVRTGEESEIADAATMGVVRVTQDLFEESSIGFLGTLGDPAGGREAWTAGSDFTYRTSRFRGDRNLLAGVWALASGRGGLRSGQTAAGVELSYPNDLWEVTLGYKRIGDAFEPPLGFVERSAVQKVNLAVNFQPRPGRFGIRQCFQENEFSWVAGLDGRWQSYRYFMAPINCRLESGDRFEFNIAPEGERLTQDFDVHDDVTIAAGTYHFLRFRLEGGLAAKRPLSAQLTWWFGGFYDGSLNQIQLTSSWKPSSAFSLGLDAERDIGHLQSGRFTTDLIGTRLTVNASPDLQAASFLQYDNDSRSIGTNTRIRWTFSPFGTIFLVYNHNLSRPIGQPWEFENNQLLIKAQYTWRY